MAWNDLRVELPSDFTLELPVHARAWPFKYGISEDTLHRFCIGYSPTYDRVVLPVYDKDSGSLDAVQMRATKDNQKPKYLNPTGPRVNSALFTAKSKYVTLLDSGRWTVITEDILSAIKVSGVVTCTSILGTNMTDGRALKLANRYDTAVLWLDPDKAGKIGTAKAIDQLKMQGMRVCTVSSPLDPKYYNKDEITEFLKGRKEC